MQKQNTLIIGGTSYFGGEIAKELILAGHNLLVTYFSERKKVALAELAKLARTKKRKFVAEKLDVVNEAQINKIISSAAVKFDNLVYSVSPPINFKKISEEKWDDFEKQLFVQIKGLFQVVVKLIDDSHPLKSRLVIGSACVFGAPPARLTSYTVAKYGQLGLFYCLVNELAHKKIRVNMISPGLSGEGISKIYPETFLRLAKSQTPLGRLVDKKDVARLAKFLLSEDAQYLTGLNIPADGGLHTA